MGEAAEGKSKVTLARQILAVGVLCAFLGVLNYIPIDTRSQSAAAAATQGGKCEEAYQRCIRYVNANETKCHNIWRNCVANKCVASGTGSTQQCPKDADCEASCTEFALSEKGLISCCSGGPRRNNPCRKDIDGKCVTPGTQGTGATDALPQNALGYQQTAQAGPLPQNPGTDFAEQSVGKGNFSPNFNAAWDNRVFEPFDNTAAGAPPGVTKSPSAEEGIANLAAESQGPTAGPNMQKLEQYFNTYTQQGVSREDLIQGLQPPTQQPWFDTPPPKIQDKVGPSSFPNFVATPAETAPTPNMFQRMWGGFRSWFGF